MASTRTASYLVRPRQNLRLPEGSILPNNVAGLKLWLDASAITGLTDGTAVGTWSDLSGNGFDATQATANQKPVYKTGIINGKPIVRFDGSNDALGLSGGALAMAQNVAGLTVFLVLASNLGGASKQPFFISRNANGSTRCAYFEGITNAGSISIGGRRLDADSFAKAESSGSELVSGTPAILSGILDYAGTAATVWHNGTQVATNASFQTAGSTSNTASTNITVGGSTNAGADPYNGDLAEIIVYNAALVTSDRKGLESYLGAKWGITVA